MALSEIKQNNQAPMSLNIFIDLNTYAYNNVYKCTEEIEKYRRELFVTLFSFHKAL